MNGQDNTQKNEIPSWMLSEEQYTPLKDKDAFLTKTILQVLSILGRARNNGKSFRETGSAYIRMPFLLLTILLVSLSHNILFVVCVLAGWLLRCCVLPGQLLRKVLFAPVGAAIVTMIVLLPAVFLGSYNTALTIAFKVLVSVGLLDTFALTTPWNRITESLRFFHVPDLFIFVFDITLKYIIILGDLCYAMLQALTLRSVGYNSRKGHSIGGVLGVTFLKSQQMAEEMYQAMSCRGFEGDYSRLKHISLRKEDLLYILGLMLILFLFYMLR